jgi:hypothetical protein
LIGGGSGRVDDGFGAAIATPCYKIVSGAIKLWQDNFASPICFVSGIACGTAVSFKLTLALLF